MNDLAEQALAAVATARRAVRDHPMLSFGVAGFLIGSVVVVLGAQVAAAGPTRPLTTWLGLQVSTHAEHGLLRPILLIVTIGVLVLTWLGLTEFVRRRPQRTGRVWRVAGAWAVPFAVGPPLLDTSVYGRAAVGLLQRRGHDPYAYSPGRLGDVPVVGAISPAGRGVPSSDGPLGTLLIHLATSVSGGSALGTVIVLRVVAVLAVVWCARIAVATAGHAGLREDRALTLVAANPLVLLLLVSAAHLDALTIGFVLAALLAARQRRWTTAVAAAAVATSIQALAVVAVLVLIAGHLGARRRSRWWVALGRDVATAAAVIAVAGFGVPGGFGWLHTVVRQFSEHTPYSIPGLTAIALRPLARGAAYDDLAIGGRAAALLALACVLGYLIATVRLRPIEQSAGFGLLGLALFAPSLHPWYLTWGALCLAATATGGRRLAVLALSAGGCVLVPPGLDGGAADAVTGALLAAVAAGALLVWRDLEHRSAAPADPSVPEPAAAYLPPETSRTAGRTSAR